ncbi:MAG: HAMP domain-containing protein, partial [Verrucomicrobiae bacterium]|nr:HAMP domain-containing protein [Verrucomicrobiae bacterium]
DQFRPAWIGTFRSLYAFTPEQTNVGFDPLLANWVYDTPADWDQRTAEWSRVANMEEDPEGEIRWTRSTQEGNTGVFYVSAVQPVIIEGRLTASFAHDMRFDQLMEDAVKNEIAGLTHMIFRRDGKIIAHPHKVQEIISTDGIYLMGDDPDLAKLYDLCQTHTEPGYSGFEPRAGNYFSVQTLDGPDWLFLTIMPRSVLTREAFHYAQWVLWAGLAALALLLVTLAATLHRTLALPLRRLISAVDRMGKGDFEVELPVDKQDELGLLASAFNQMAQNVHDRDRDLRKLNEELEQRIEERTRQLESSEGRMWSLIEQSPGAVIVFDSDTGYFVAANEWALQSMGLTREQLSKTHVMQVSVERQEDGRSSLEVLRQAVDNVRQGESAAFEWLHRRTDGVLVPSEVRMRRIHGLDRNLIIALFVDITKRKEAEQKIVEALNQERELNEMKSNFVSMVSHEFRTPLGIISSSAEILEQYLDRLIPERRQEHLNSIVTSTRRLGQLMEEVILLGKVETGRLECNPIPLDLVSLCSRIADEVKSAIGEQRSIEIIAQGDLAGARGDESLLRHIFSNLLSNAIKYSDAAVVFTISRQAESVVFEIRDQGIGIHDEDVRNLFSAFHRGSNVGHRPGTGLGMLIVQRCTRIHGGDIAVESEVGMGTRFTVALPLFPKTTNPAKKNIPSAP